MKTAALEPLRLRACVCGAVQGVGFRPFVFRLATELGLKGWVNNSSGGVSLEVEGGAEALNRFLMRLHAEKPPRSSIHSLESSWLDSTGFERFEIRASDATGEKSALILPDIATCPDCLREILDPRNRRHLYPFINCTNCGPRFSIIEALPYDRANTSMRQFAMCADCETEYNDPSDRRFQAQPNACPNCGPQLELWNAAGEVLQAGGEVLAAAACALEQGKVVAVKGLGGFHLLVAAHNDRAVRRLRDLKRREEKPLAVMFPSLEAVKNVCEVSAMEARLLSSPEAPIVLLGRLAAQLDSPFQIAAEVAPGNPNLGAFLPGTPLHHLLLLLTGFPVVATSGNLSDEPICIDEREALERLGEMADLFLVHNRPIVRHLDDSVARVILGREQILRRARGYAPLPVVHRRNESSSPADGATVLAVGAHLKNSVALGRADQTFISQHIGDLETEKAYTAFRRVTADLQNLYAATPACIAADAHPDYLSTKFAAELAAEGGLPLISVQHHVAHVLSCMAEYELAAPVLGVSWDGTGYGLDGTIWGGEFFSVSETACDRVAYLRPFRLPGGERAVKEPRRTALGLLHELDGDAALGQKKLPLLREFSASEITTLLSMLNREVNSPLTSS
ncbi:MAG: carbamoyltransferase HypF, partial [Akkermansiaceae bacterium]|nr:carbamoyltransferase HypF [Verrucomicrobiales bacterium]